VTASPIFVQLGLFGGCAEVAGMHLVSAHTRVLADGTEVQVTEHLRWDRGRQARRPPSLRRAAVADDEHPSLFDPPRRPMVHMEEVEVFPGAYQLPLWRS
jgi:hypothetical protein